MNVCEVHIVNYNRNSIPFINKLCKNMKRPKPELTLRCYENSVRCNISVGSEECYDHLLWLNSGAYIEQEVKCNTASKDDLHILLSQQRCACVHMPVNIHAVFYLKFKKKTLVKQVICSSSAASNYHLVFHPVIDCIKASIAMKSRTA